MFASLFKSRVCWWFVAVAAAGCQFPDYDLMPFPAGGAGAAGAGEAGGPSIGGNAGQQPNAGSAGQAGSASTGGTDANGEAGAAAEAGAGGNAPYAPITCASLIADGDDLPSGDYVIDPDGSEPGPTFSARCDMELDGGGWTLLGSFVDTTFDVGNSGSTTNTCYEEVCANRAYSTLPLGRDLLLDFADEAILADAIDGRAVLRRIEPTTSGRTLRDLFTTDAPSFVQAPDSVVTINWFNGKGCQSWQNFGAGLCQDGIQLVFQDPSPCSARTVFQIGLGSSFSTVLDNCDGWPQSPGANFPRAFRVWTR